MIWLVTHMWTVLGVAAVCGLAFGWAIRGLGLKSKVRDAIVARDVALTELAQSRYEIDQLYAAQSKGVEAASEAGDETLRAELEARASHVQSLSEELAASREQLEELKAQGAAAARAPAQDGAGGQPRLDAELNTANAAFEWRNRYLESRVRTLEAEAAGQSTPANAEVSADEAMPDLKPQLDEALAGLAVAKARIADLESAGEAETAGAHSDQESNAPNDAGLALQAWKNRYLQQRLTYLEANPILSRDASPPPPAGGAEADNLSTLTVVDADTEAASGTEADNGAQDSGEMEQELARLRWRNRYLEGRLAYIDGDAPKSDAEIAEAESVTEKLDGTVSPQPESEDVAAVEELTEAASTDAGKTESQPARIPDPEDAESLAAVAASISEISAASDAQAVAADENEEDSASPADTFLATLESEGRLLKPAMVPPPMDGGDDLMRIDGIGGQTSEILQDLGIWLFEQIAGWSSENVAWVNRHFNAETRIEDEKWVEQAAALMVRENAN